MSSVKIREYRNDLICPKYWITQVVPKRGRRWEAHELGTPAFKSQLYYLVPKIKGNSLCLSFLICKMKLIIVSLLRVVGIDRVNTLMPDTLQMSSVRSNGDGRGGELIQICIVLNSTWHKVCAHKNSRQKAGRGSSKAQLPPSSH